MCTDLLQAMVPPGPPGRYDEFTPEERQVLAAIRRRSKRTCAWCAWMQTRGSHKGCFPEGKYRKWLSPTEFDAGCALFVRREGMKERV